MTKEQKKNENILHQISKDTEQMSFVAFVVNCLPVFTLK